MEPSLHIGFLDLSHTWEKVMIKTKKQFALKTIAISAKRQIIQEAEVK